MKIVTFEGLQCYHNHLKQYIDMRIGIEVHGKTNCPNCGAVIDNTDKCEYCGTIFKLWMCD